MNVWRIGSNWDGFNLCPIFKSNRIAFAGYKVENSVRQINAGDVVAITHGQPIVGVGKVAVVKRLKEDFPELATKFEDVWCIHFDQLFFQEDWRHVDFKIYDGGGKQFHGAGDDYSSQIINLINNLTLLAMNQEIETLLRFKKQVILQGPPGTGKTYNAKEIAQNMCAPKQLTSEHEDFIRSCFHPEMVLRTVANYDFIVKSRTPDGFALEIGNKTKYSVSIQQIMKVYNEPKPNVEGNSYAIPMANLVKEKLAEAQTKLIQFHPSYTYEDFVRGIVAKPMAGGGIDYVVEDKVLAQFANDAIDEPEKDYVLIIDEINRANLPAVLGELIYALEYRFDKNDPNGPSVDSLYAIKKSKEDKGGRKLSLPPNLYIIGTMNTADRSVGHIDYAIRRRFSFYPVGPDEAVIKRTIIDPAVRDFALKAFRKVSNLFDEKAEDKKTPKYLALDFKPEDVALGHSYFLTKKTGEEGKKEIELKLKYEVKPILLEYIKDGILLEDARNIIENL